MAQRTLFQRTGYQFIRGLLRLLSVTFFRLRFQGRERIPAEGGALVCSNHQSYLDPIFVGVVFQRRLNYLARKTLFRFGPFGWLLGFIDVIPIDRDGFGLGGIKETLTRLKRGELVLVFPEGTRTATGELAPLKPGFVALARRSKTGLLPVGLDGAFNAWPRSARWPRPAKVHVCIGEMIPPERVTAMTDEDLVAELERRIRACQSQARIARQR